MLTYADFHFAPDGDVLVTLDDAGLVYDRPVTLICAEGAMVLSQEGAPLVCVPALDEEVRAGIAAAPEVKVLEMRKDGSVALFGRVDLRIA